LIAVNPDAPPPAFSQARRPVFPARRPLLLLCLLAFLPWCFPAEAALANRAGIDRFFPATGALPGLRQAERPRRVRVKTLGDALGSDAANIYLRNGVEDYAVADYDFAGASRSVTVAIAVFADPLRAAAVFHEYRANPRFLNGQGEAVPVGAEAALDAKNNGRNLYFYKQRAFVRVIYSGPAPVPDLTELARLVAATIPGDDRMPAAFEKLQIEGIDPSTLAVTPGPLFGLDFFPRAATAEAPGAGFTPGEFISADAYVAVFATRKAAEDAAKLHHAYLRRNAENFDAGTSGGGLSWWRATDPDQGRMIAAVRENVLYVVARPKNYDAGLAFLERLASGDAPAREDEAKSSERRLRIPFRRAK